MSNNSHFPDTPVSSVKTRFHYSFLKILTGSDLSRRRIPYMRAESGVKGPRIWLTGGVHGDEVGGVVVIQEVFRKLRRTGLLRGTLHAFPLMNPIGFETGSRNITMSTEDLNRSFPGSMSGSLAERIASLIFTTMTRTQPNLVIDLHNDWMNSIPYTTLDPKPKYMRRKTYDSLIEYAKMTGFLSVLDTDYLPTTLSASLLTHGVLALTLELGESFVVNEKNVEFGLNSIWNILSGMQMIAPETRPFIHEACRKYGDDIFTFSSKPTSSTSGIIRFQVKPGDYVKAGNTVAKIFNAFGKLQESVTALNDAVVLGHSDSSVAFPGAPLMAFANKDE